MDINNHTLMIGWRPRFERYRPGDQIRFPQHWRHSMRILAAEHSATSVTLTLARWHWWDGILRWRRRAG